MSALVQGEDSESDEEINTEHMTPIMETSLRRHPPHSRHARITVPGIVAGEGSETDEEDGASDQTGTSASQDQTDGGATLHVLSSNVSHGSSPRSSSRRSSGDSSAAFPPPS